LGWRSWVSREDMSFLNQLSNMLPRTARRVPRLFRVSTIELLSNTLGAMADSLSTVS
jgi:hypothetical protein